MSVYLGLVSVALMGILTHIYFRKRENYKDDRKALAVKGACTSIPVLLCLYALMTTDAPIKVWLLFAGVFLCMVADVVIGIHFVAGMLIFLVAHVCFIAYYFTLAPIHGFSIILFVVLFSCVAKHYWRYVPSLKGRLVPFTAYPAVLVFMFSVAAMLPFTLGSAGSVCLAAGAGLFVLSDSVLADTTLGSITKVKDRMVMYLYYPAVYLLAVSAFYM